MPNKVYGGSFLVTQPESQDQFIPEDLTSEHLAIIATAEAFWANDVAPHLDAIHCKEPGVLLSVLRKSAELGFTGLSIPEEFGGMDVDLASVMIVEECFARDASYLVTHGGQAGIGALPLVFFGTDDQQQKYLPKLASAEWIAAYALTEPQAGSDALNVRTRADLAPDGKHYLLNGQKMWITNGGFADLVTVFAKVGGEHFTAFLVERAWPGVSIGAEEKKMGLSGSSTTAVYFDNVTVPIENVLGEAGRGHIIAFNVLNIGRLKVGPDAVGAGKEVLLESLKYARERRAFGSAIADFGAIQHKLAEMAVHVFAAESMYWRVVGLIDQAMDGGKLKAVEEFAIECSMVKVFASEAIGYIADEGVQIHGGYGFHQDYAVERFYRDARIFRIFEGSNEINRQLIVNMLLKRCERGRLTLSTEHTDTDAITQAKALAVATLQAAQREFGGALAKQQEILMSIADIMIETFAMESVSHRAEKLRAAHKGANAIDMAQVFCAGAAGRIDAAAREIFAACGRRDDPVVPVSFTNTIALRRGIAQRLLAAGRYAV